MDEVVALRCAVSTSDPPLMLFHALRATASSIIKPPAMPVSLPQVRWMYPVCSASTSNLK